jgi:hypothetical protein
MVITSRIFQPKVCEHPHYVYMGEFRDGEYMYETYRCDKCGKKEVVFLGSVD